MSSYLSKICTIILLFIIAVFNINSVLAQDLNRIALTITPPLIKINMNPGETWSSSIKIINNNPRVLTVYTQIFDFKGGERGGVKFIKEYDESTEAEKKHLLSQWLEINQEPINLAAYQSQDIVFTIKVPKNAEPGGHYAAILAGIKPAKKIEKGSGINISSMLSSLVMLKINGEINEKGQIEEFSTDKRFYQSPEVDFTIRFNNSGNVHLQPQGEIKIYNFFGKVKGIIPINQKSESGNVLPESTRKWEFNWKVEDSLLEIGRFKADLVLGFGEEARQHDFQSLYFWVINLKPTLTILGGLLLFLLFIIYFARRYIKRSVAVAQRQVKLDASIQSEFLSSSTNDVINLRNVNYLGKKKKKVRKSNKFFTWSLFKKSIIFIFILVIVLAIILFSHYNNIKNNKNANLIQTLEKKFIDSSDLLIESMKSDLSNTIDYDIIPTNQKHVEEIEDEILLQSKEEATTTDESKTIEQPKQLDRANIVLKVLNGSGSKGIASKMSKLLESEGFKIASMGNADTFSYEITMIKYKKDNEEEAIFINQLLGGYSKIKEDKIQEEDIIVIVGENFQ